MNGQNSERLEETVAKFVPQWDTFDWDQKHRKRAPDFSAPLTPTTLGYRKTLADSIETNEHVDVTPIQGKGI